MMTAVPQPVEVHRSQYNHRLKCFMHVFRGRALQEEADDVDDACGSFAWLGGATSTLLYKCLEGGSWSISVHMILAAIASVETVVSSIMGAKAMVARQ